MSKMNPIIQTLYNQAQNHDYLNDNVFAGTERCVTRSAKADKKDQIARLLELAQISISYKNLTEKDEEDLDSGSKLKAFEEMLMLLPSVWSNESLTKLSFVRLSGLAQGIRTALFEEEVELTYADPKSARIMSLVARLAELTCTKDAFHENEKPDLQQIQLVKDSSASILNILADHPTINLQIIHCCILRLMEVTAVNRNLHLDHLILEEIYWILHVLDSTLAKDNASLSHPLTISRWPVVSEVTESIIIIQRSIQHPENRLNDYPFFMDKWQDILVRFNVYFTCTV